MPRIPDLPPDVSVTASTLIPVYDPGTDTTYNASTTQVVVAGAGGIGISGITRSITSISSPATAGAVAATDYVYLVSGTTTLTLPTAAGNRNLYTVKNSGSNTVTIATTSSQTIDGSSSITLPVANTSVDLLSNGSNWYVA